MRIKKTSIVLAFYYLVGATIALLGPSILPDYYYNDSKYIQELVSDSSTFLSVTDSYKSTAFFYKAVGLGALIPEWLAALFGYSIAFFLLIILLRKIKWHWNLITIAFLGIWNVLMAVYYGQFSKEPLAFIISFLLVLLCGSKKGNFFAVILILLYSPFFRLYWLIVLGLSSVVYLLFKSRFKLTAALAFQIIVALVVSQLAYSTIDTYLSDARTEVNEIRQSDEESKTLIENIIPNSSAVTDVINSLFNWVRLMLPFYLLTVSSVKYIPFILFELSNLALFIHIARYLLKNSVFVENLLGAIFYRKLLIATSWIFSYSFVQGFFEPDFGSFARHQVVLLPMWMLLLTTRFGILNRVKPPLLPKNLYGPMAEKVQA
jgi:hypothetical protein